MKKKDKRTCPCGCGKPFALCCGRLTKVVSIEQFGFKRASQQLRRKLGAFADQPFLAREVTRAQKIYLNKINSEMIEQYDEFILERCFEWAIFDYKLMTGETIIEMFQRNPDLTGQEQQLLRDWSQSRISLYEVENISSSKNDLTLHDLVCGSRITVYDPNAAQELDQGMILLMRVLKVGDEYEFSTSGMALPSICKDLLLGKIRNDLELYCIKRNIPVAEGANQYLRDNACLLNSWVIEINLNNPDPFTTDEESDKDIPTDKESFSSEIAREITNVLFDDYYDRWVNCPISALNGLTPKQACRSSEGRKFLKEMLYELEQVEIERECNGEPSYDFSKVWQRLGLPREKTDNCDTRLSLVKNEPGTVNNWRQNPGDYQWPYPSYAQVALQVLEDLTTRGCSQNQLNSALRLWHDFCWTEHPTIRKANVWVATIIYAMARLELDRKVNRQELAERYGIAPSTISSNFRKLCLTLELPDYDHRYSAHKPAIPDLNVDYSLLARIWKTIKI